MKDYSKMSDFEINKAVADCEGVYWHSRPDDNPTKSWVYSAMERKSSVHVTSDLPDYCNNPSDSWPIMDEHKIGLVFVNTEWRANSALVGYQEYSDTKAFRAAMIVYLMMKDEEQ